ncbi:MAG: polymer-forming cytoskeletal protein [Candidatus Omnitrophica bacterium]|nr:polymer-forming cytoskeletal protein [Candidatus Omnitrophota bacterium]MDD5081399.1 polymer-forming cytoskeletal protein [Candidatus Omnitrophota bacterium]MDD5440766.1 polymer-forming cytoskeletal protein [Candidatus Omnitrophota bacterium]
MVKKKDFDEKILDVNAAMQGSLVFSDPVNLRINGKFEGNLTSKGTLLIGEQADVSAKIIGEIVEISGKVKGTIKASKYIALKATAQVYADIDTPALSMDKGSVFNGKSVMSQGKMTLNELSEYLSVEEDKIMEWVDNGRIPADKMDNNLVFDRKDVEVWISRNT